jgi:hypothetical protein
VLPSRYRLHARFVNDTHVGQSSAVAESGDPFELVGFRRVVQRFLARLLAANRRRALSLTTSVSALHFRC